MSPEVSVEHKMADPGPAVKCTTCEAPGFREGMIRYDGHDFCNTWCIYLYYRECHEIGDMHQYPGGAE